MAKYSTWKEVRKKRSIDQVEARRLTREFLAKSQDATLADIRLALDITQREMADIMGIDQSNVSRIERGKFSNTEVGTLQAYIEALGGELEIKAKIGAVSHTLVDSQYERAISKAK